uniref:Uncharacterized protein n=1 Tax=Picea sitchensis TaxID=3332 RepID=A0A6B9XVS1_PICSI|nr:hypothetical protein Q903MT_gene3779 [Picea sitchensis]
MSSDPSMPEAPYPSPDTKPPLHLGTHITQIPFLFPPPGVVGTPIMTTLGLPGQG